ncbi:MAG: esterase/lipase family protein [Steroidobacterales bacterium]
MMAAAAGRPPAAVAVAYVHGLWMPGDESFLLRLRMEREHGWHFQVFRYASVAGSVAEIVAALDVELATIKAERVHLVGHSLGGVIILRYLERHRPAAPGRVVFLGTPAVKCAAAQALGRFRFGRTLLGQVVAEELLTAHEFRWQSERELGIIAGTHALSLGQLVVKFDEPNDGTVAVSETRLPGATAHLCLPVTHTSMLLSARVAQETWSFLQYGRFGV